MSDALFEQLDFEPKAQFEKIISDLMDHRYSVVPDFLLPAETASLRNVLLKKYADDAFRKAAIGNRFNEHEVRPSRRDRMSLTGWLKTR